VHVIGSTGAVGAIEFEPGLQRDLPDILDRLMPPSRDYGHEQAWHDGNGHSHVRAAMQGASLTVPFTNSNLLLGTWQQIIFIDFDNRSRRREVIVQLTGKKN
ncbi:MAG: YjbQ family protein, partial [Bacteroidetes bacterium]|nr:YjbQ family protein [Bacteroidota bacterium]